MFLDELLLPASRQIYERAVVLRPVPNLYHYTSHQGMMGILKSRSIWATECRYLNDTSEVSYAEGLIRETVEAEAKSLPPPYQAFIHRFGEVVGYVSSRMAIHVASFCQERDNLCQWRAYARTGVSIGLVGAALEELPDCHIVKVEYRPDVQRRLVRETIVAHLAGFEEIVRLKDERMLVVISSQFAFQLLLYASAFKHPAFADEREWRAVTGASPKNVLHRRTGSIEQPYVTLNLEVHLGQGMELVDVLHSPFLNPITAKPEVERILTECGCDAALATSSTAPLRVISNA